MEENVTENSISVEEKEDSSDNKSPKSKEQKSGIIYLSRIPTGMDARVIRQYFSRFGETGRVFLQQHQHGGPAKRNKKRRLYSEGWLEFHRKKIAKQVAASLNNAPIGGKKKNAWREELWNIKYLPKFKWGHLHERLEYERVARSQRMRAEITQAKKQANFYIENAERNAKLKRKAKKQLKDGPSDTAAGDTSGDKGEKVFEFRQKATEEEIVVRRGEKRTSEAQTEIDSVAKKKKHKKVRADPVMQDQTATRKSFLTKIFSGGLDSDAD